MAKQKIVSIKSLFYTSVSLVWIFALAAIAHIIMVLIEKHNPVIKYELCVVLRHYRFSDHLYDPLVKA